MTGCWSSHALCGGEEGRQGLASELSVCPWVCSAGRARRVCLPECAGHSRRLVLGCATESETEDEDVGFVSPSHDK